MNGSDSTTQAGTTGPGTTGPGTTQPGTTQPGTPQPGPVPGAPPARARRTSSPSHTSARRLPRPQSLPVQPAGEPSIGDTGLGQITVADTVVARLAARAAVEVDDVGAAAPRLLGVELSGGGLDKVGVRSSETGALPTASATVDGGLAFVELTLSVRYPASVRQVADAVRSQVRDRVGQLTGLQVIEVDVKVPALVSAPARRRRVL